MATTAVLTLTPLSSTYFSIAHTFSKLSSALTSTSIKPKFRSYQIKAIKEKAEEIQTPPSSSSSSSSSSVDEVTKKYGLEVGLWKVLNSTLFLNIFLCLILLAQLLRNPLSHKFSLVVGRVQKEVCTRFFFF